MKSGLKIEVWVEEKRGSREDMLECELKDDIFSNFDCKYYLKCW